MSESHFTEAEERAAAEAISRTRPTLGMHGVVHDPVIDANGRPVYCRDECICSHCNTLSGRLWAMEHGAGLGYPIGRDLWRSLAVLFAVAFFVLALAVAVCR